METRGENLNDQSRGRLPISRRSCDNCRTRKIGCDRENPCANCLTAKLDCTYSAIAATATAPKQRVLISAQYEQKIDAIANSIDGIKNLLQGLNVSADKKQAAVASTRYLNLEDWVHSPDESKLKAISEGDPTWDHSAHVLDFIKYIVNERSARGFVNGANEVMSSLKKLVQIMENPAAVRNSLYFDAEIEKQRADPPMPPLEAVVAVLRWVKEHQSYSRIVWISRILPLDKFAEICKKVYFAVDDYDRIDLVLTNGYLSYIFSEHALVTGLSDYQKYSELCRNNLRGALLKLPLLLPATIEAIAALAFGGFHAIESSKATMAWTFISAATNLCLTLGYHRLISPRINNQPTAEENLFWIIYTMEKGLSLRFGRTSGICDTDITLPTNRNEPVRARIARIQGKVYDQLYSPIGLSRPVNERDSLARVLAEEIREVINETQTAIFTTMSQETEKGVIEMQLVYLQCDLVCQSSLLVLILRAINTAQGSGGVSSDDCLAAARNTLDLHQQCMMSVRSCKTDATMLIKYLNWAVLHTPFVPFSILFTYAVNHLDVADLTRLERFAASLRYVPATGESITHPYRLYDLLCQAARLYINSSCSSSLDQTLVGSLPDSLDEFDFGPFETEERNAINEISVCGSSRSQELGDWFYGNQQIMSLLDEDVTF